MTVSTECWMLACRECGDPSCDHDCHVTRLQDPPLPSAATTHPWSPQGPGVAAEGAPPAPAPAASTNQPPPPTADEVGAVSGVAGSLMAVGKPPAGVRGPAAPGAPVAVAGDEHTLRSSETATGTTNPFPRAFFSSDCRYARHPAHECQVCATEAAAAAQELFERYRSVG